MSDKKTRVGSGEMVGVDEAGRGCWAGPVVAAAVWIADDQTRDELKAAGVRDSKKLSAKRRQELYTLLRHHPKVRSTIGLADAKEIDDTNIRQATLKSMSEAVADLAYLLNHEGRGPLRQVWVDGKDTCDVPSFIECKAIVGGDDLEICISAASIVAKEFRDRLLNKLDQIYPGYQFAKNKAYGVPDHIKALAELGPTPIHRFSYKPLIKLHQSWF